MQDTDPHGPQHRRPMLRLLGHILDARIEDTGVTVSAACRVLGVSRAFWYQLRSGERGLPIGRRPGLAKILDVREELLMVAKALSETDAFDLAQEPLPMRGMGFRMVAKRLLVQLSDAEVAMLHAAIDKLRENHPTRGASMTDKDIIQQIKDALTEHGLDWQLKVTSPGGPYSAWYRWFDGAKNKRLALEHGATHGVMDGAWLSLHEIIETVPKKRDAQIVADAMFQPGHDVDAVLAAQNRLGLIGPCLSLAGLRSLWAEVSAAAHRAREENS